MFIPSKTMGPFMPMVFPEKCGECHPKQVAQFEKSRHSIGWERMRTQGEYLAIPEGIRGAFCERCHLVEKRCNTCHASHGFSLEEARDVRHSELPMLVRFLDGSQHGGRSGKRIIRHFRFRMGDARKQR